MCREQGSTKVVCCRPPQGSDPGNQDKSFCQPSETKNCTTTFNRIPEKWFAFCPQATPKNCGGYVHLWGLEEKQKWGMTDMHHWFLEKKTYYDKKVQVTDAKPWKEPETTITYTKKDVQAEYF